MTEAAQPNAQPIFNIEKLYVKDLSLEIPNAPGIFLERENPQIDLQLHTQATPLEEGVFDVTVTVTVTAKLAEKDKVMFLIEARQSGIFQIRNLPAEDMETVLAVACPNILYPYLREVVSDVAVRGGFAPVLLNPINFEAMYQQQKQAQAAEAVKH
ncbi:protein-export chaperone SecB [Sideroxydans lithotrophicus]|uniref:Protein-export protein SecB n=1 Tax=Sideroxydans lithotrophicus (strain ES-1) TaxID=580332 RepID=D5CNE0_SIDLE|nr:protein-export chaperone SecB [Sideroxydans lithotrophicus]ADE12837.1 protein-export protein SecB [Sideroxydans lithotrophicus ES-1]